MNKATKNGIDYLYHAKEAIGRVGYSLNIVTGCKHHESDICNIPCYAKRLVETRFADSSVYPYGFDPTYHPERIRHYGGKPKLIFLNDMSDVGGDWDWDYTMEHQPSDGEGIFHCTSEHMAEHMVRFANMNPEHIILLLTKNPAWYGLQEWPENVKKGFTATNNKELGERWFSGADWISLEPWLDDNAPVIPLLTCWIAIGGQSNPNRPLSDATKKWLDYIERPHEKPRPAFKIFVKKNSGWNGTLREYPEEFSIYKSGDAT